MNMTGEGEKGRGEVAVPISEKYLLSIRESAAYFGIGEKRLRRLAAEHPGEIGIACGSRILIHRAHLEKLLDKTSAV